MADGEIITKAALARELDVSKARVSQMVSSGLPVRADGKIDRNAALLWVKAHARRPQRRDQLHGGALNGANRALALSDADALPGPSLNDICSLSVVATKAASDAALAMLQAGIAPAAVRRLAEEIGEAVVRGAVALVDEDYGPPRGHQTWATHPWFSATPWVDEWDELVEIARSADLLDPRRARR